jgi:DNA-binding NarL/FixJ family response regulator
MVKRQRVLIVDDHSGARAALHAMVSLQRNMQVVGEAENGLAAIDAVARLEPQLVLMDITMPEMNGIEAAAEIKRRYTDVRVLMVTMHDNEEYVRACAQAGADGYVLKDAGREQFRTAIRNALTTKRSTPPTLQDSSDQRDLIDPCLSQPPLA